VVALGQHVVAVAGDHLLAHHFGHVRGVDLDLALVRAGVHRQRARGVRLGAAHVAQFRHARQDVVVAAQAGAFRVADRIAAGRELGNAGQGGGLVQGQCVELLPVIELGRSGHAVGAVAEETLVEVELQDLVLGQLALHLHRQQHLRELAAEAVLGAEEELLGHLLGDGGAAGHALLAAGLDQQPDGACDAGGVDPVVLVEIGVLGGEEGLLDLQRHGLDLHRISTHLPEQPHQAAVVGVHVHRFLQLGAAQGLHVGQARGHDGGQDREGDDAEHCKRDAAQQNQAQGAGEAGHRHRFRLRVSWPRSIEEASSVRIGMQGAAGSSQGLR